MVTCPPPAPREVGPSPGRVRRGPGRRGTGRRGSVTPHAASRWRGREPRSTALRLSREGTLVSSKAVERTRELASCKGLPWEPARGPSPRPIPVTAGPRPRPDSRQHQGVLGEAAGPGVLLVVEHGQCPQDGSQALPRHQHCRQGGGQGPAATGPRAVRGTDGPGRGRWAPALGEVRGQAPGLQLPSSGPRL